MKIFVFNPIVLAAFLAAGFLEQAMAAPPTPVAAITQIEHDMMVASNADEAVKDYDPSVIVHDMTGNTMAGRAGVRDDFAKLFGTLKDPRVTVLTMAVQANGTLGFADSTQHLTAASPTGGPAIDMCFAKPIAFTACTGDGWCCSSIFRCRSIPPPAGRFSTRIEQGPVGKNGVALHCAATLHEVAGTMTDHAQPDASPERVVGLHAARNFRDLGGYETVAGRRIRWRRVYRSGKLSTLTGADLQSLAQRRINSVIDLRAADERAAAPSRWPGRPDYLYESAKPTTAPIIRAILANAGSVEAVQANGLRHYAAMTEAYRDEFSVLFKRLAAGGTPLLVHCTAGKDRTGVASALLLAALGVARPAICADFTLTAALLQMPSAASLMPELPVGGATAHAELIALPTEIRAALWAAEPANIEAALVAVDDLYGSIGGYMRRALNMSSAEIEALRELLTE